MNQYIQCVFIKEVKWRTLGPTRLFFVCFTFVQIKVCTAGFTFVFYDVLLVHGQAVEKQMMINGNRKQLDYISIAYN